MSSGTRAELVLVVFVSAILSTGCWERNQADSTAAAGAPIKPDKRLLDDRIRDSRVLQDSIGAVRLSVVATGIVLRPDTLRRWPDPGPQIVRDGHGRFFSTSASERGVVLVWDAAGRFDTTLGRLGSEPGAFSRGIQLFVGPENQLYVYGSGRWSIFDSSLKRMRTVSTVVGPNLARGSSTLLRDGSVLTGYNVTSERGHYFLRTALDGSVKSAIASVPAGAKASGRIRPFSGRQIAYSGGDYFWAAPMMGMGSGYMLEKWGIDGRLISSLRRNAKWFEQSLDEWPRNPETGRPPPFFPSITEDSTGLLFVSVTIPNADWRHIKDARERERVEGQLFDVRTEVIDPSGMRVIAATGPAPRSDSLNHGFVRRFPGTRLGYVRLRTADGRFAYEIVRYELRTITSTADAARPPG